MAILLTTNFANTPHGAPGNDLDASLGVNNMQTSYQGADTAWYSGSVSFSADSVSFRTVGAAQDTQTYGNGGSYVRNGQALIQPILWNVGTEGNSGPIETCQRVPL